LPPEQPTGYRIDDMEPLEQTSLAPPVAQGNLGDADVPSSLCDVEPASPLSLGDPAVVSISQPSRHVHPEREAGSLPRRKL
jgi:hypothetical protein